MKRVIIIVGIILVILVSGLVLLINKLDNDVEVILNDQIIDFTLDDENDGTYFGEYKVALAVSAEVEVTVINNKITDIIILEHKNGQGEPAEQIIIDIIDKQSLMVDDIAGATYSSRVLKHAIYNAIEGEKE